MTNDPLLTALTAAFERREAEFRDLVRLVREHQRTCDLAQDFCPGSEVLEHARMLSRHDLSSLLMVALVVAARD